MRIKDYFRQTSILRFITHALLLMVLPAFVAFFMSWSSVIRSSGEGAVINLAGSLRKQTYLIVATHLSPPAPVPGSRPYLQQVIDDFEQRLYHPILLSNLPSEQADPVRVAYNKMEMSWRTEIKHDLSQLNTTYDGQLLPKAMQFVTLIDHYVAAIEDKHEARLLWLGRIQWISLGVMICVLLLTLKWLSRSVTRPLIAMAQAATQIRQGDLNIRAPEEGAGEITQLGQAINHMVSELAEGIAELESRVTKKTKALSQNQRSLEFLYRMKQILSDQEPDQATFDQVLNDLGSVIELEHAAICITETEQAPLAFRFAIMPNKDIEHCNQNSCQDCTEAVNQPPQTINRPVFQLSDGRKNYGIMPIQLKPEQVLADWQLQLLEAVARQIGTALANAKRKQESHRLALHEERSVIARELHDSLAQSLSYLKIQVVRLQKQFPEAERSPTAQAALSELREGLNGAYRQLRELLNTFRLQMHERGLAAALEQTAQEFTERIGHPILLKNHLMGVELSAHEEIHILQIIREALANIEHHAAAQHAWIGLTWEEHRILVTIEDDGCGISQHPDKKQHYGLSIMRDRAHSLNGQFNLQRREPSGTLVSLRFTPVTPFAPQGATS
ncbi:histidine kinase [Iodobacter sp. CM08]|uniref:HAMP domain-containing protein n=1 Tax=Iodobacter sp. CM08 TaxID=3085902 RepID=UPI002980D6EA|nr:HAMP domain-containing protein [Iodobacter sp. CM08]MDW5416617.1 histidine kinase [Iodobacter sp. CM08]